MGCLGDELRGAVDDAPADSLVLPPSTLSLCESCGACCHYSHAWPRFSLETDAELDLIPSALVATDFSGMRCDGDRCSALKGKIGTATGCAIYAVRPHVCRACMPGDDACQMARERHGLPRLDGD